MKFKFGVTILIIFAIGCYAFFMRSSIGCGLQNGKWSNSSRSCTTRMCYGFNSCGKWASPIQWCENLKLGDSINTVYFQLGEPELVQGENYQWNSYKGSSEKIHATISNHTLKEVQCKTI